MTQILPIDRDHTGIPMTYQNLQEILEELEEGTLVYGMVPTALMAFVDDTNIDLVIAELPRDVREFVIDWAHEVAFAPEDDLLHIVGQTNLGDTRSEADNNPRRSSFLSALRGWFTRHSRPVSTTKPE
jgi:hypothetical protein